LAVLFTVGCEPPTSEDLLLITFDDSANAPPVEVDVVCINGGCDPLDLVATLTFEQHDLLSSSAEVEILQYKVEYDIASDAEAEEPPFYANYTSVLVALGESASFTVVAVGQSQRDWVFEEYGGGTIDSAIGRLTLAGFDHKNEVVEVDAQFAIRFGDFVDNDPADPGTP